MKSLSLRHASFRSRLYWPLLERAMLPVSGSYCMKEVETAPDSNAVADVIGTLLCRMRGLGKAVGIRT